MFTDDINRTMSSSAGKTDMNYFPICIYIYILTHTYINLFIITGLSSCVSFSPNKQERKADKKGRKADERRSRPRKDVKDRMRSRLTVEGSL